MSSDLTLFPISPEWSALKKNRCPFCGKKLRDRLQGTTIVSICVNPTKHLKPFLIREEKKKLFGNTLCISD